MENLLPIGIGILAGICSGLFGIGGGVIIVPMLVFFFKYTQQMATGTSLIALLLPVGVLGVWQYYRAGLIGRENFSIGLLTAGGILIGTLVGARIATQLSGEILTKMFAVFLGLIAIRLWWVAH